MRQAVNTQYAKHYTDQHSQGLKQLVVGAGNEKILHNNECEIIQYVGKKWTELWFLSGRRVNVANAAAPPDDMPSLGFSKDK